MFITVSPHCKDQARIRDLESELDSGIEALWDIRIDGSGEVNVIVERKAVVLERSGSTGDLVVIGIDVDSRTAKSIFLQHSWQVENRKRKIGKVYLDLEV